MGEKVGRAVRQARESHKYSLRELARRAGISAASLSRIEAGEVQQPSMETLGAIARALDRNPRFLWIACGHIGGEDAYKVFGDAFGEGSDLLGHWASGKDAFKKATTLLERKSASDKELRALAVEVFRTWQTEEPVWWDAYLEPLVRTASEDMKPLVQDFALLSPKRKKKVQEYMRDQVELNLIEMRRDMGEDV